MSDDHFNLVYLETEPLFRLAWPSEPVELLVFLSLAQFHSVAVIIPEPVEMERQRQWITDIVGKPLDYLRAEYTRVERLCERWGVVAPVLAGVPDEAQLYETYTRLAEDIKRNWRIQTSPLTSASLREVYEMALRRQAAFEKKEKSGTVGMQDTVILLSVLEDLKKRPNAHAVIVSGDGVFTAPAVNAWIQQENVALTVATSLSEVITGLRTRIGPAEVWEADIAEATAQLKGRRTELAELLRAALEPSALPGGEVAGVVIKQLSNVQTPSVENRRPGLVRVSADALLDVYMQEIKLFRDLEGRQTGKHVIGREIHVEAKIEVSIPWNGVYASEPIRNNPKAHHLQDLNVVAASLHRAESSLDKPGLQAATDRATTD